jgi:hypothetical protein
MTPKLSPRTAQLLEKLFSPDDIPEVTQRLERDCGNNLPFCDTLDEYQMERLRFGAIKLSEGQISNLVKAIDLACQDWRDLLMASDFGYQVDAYSVWAKEILEK